MMLRPVRALLLTLLLALLLPGPVWPQGDLSLMDALGTDDKKPASTLKPRPRGPAVGNDFNLADALDPSNDLDTSNKKKQGGDFSDADLDDVSKDKTYKPDKGKGGRINSDTSRHGQYDENGAETIAEVGTIAGIVSAVCMALVGAVSSYISYQKKKLCFGIQLSGTVSFATHSRHLKRGRVSMTNDCKVCEKVNVNILSTVL